MHRFERDDFAQEHAAVELALNVAEGNVHCLSGKERERDRKIKSEREKKERETEESEVEKVGRAMLARWQKDIHCGVCRVEMQTYRLPDR